MAIWRERVPKKKYRKSDGIIDKLAKIRGIDDVDLFMNPEKGKLHDPYLLDNIGEARNRTLEAIEKEEKILLSVDCDNDGLVATSSLYMYLRNFTDNIDIVYSERHIGHGISKQLDQIQDDVDLLIIPDSSSNEVKECKYLSEEMDIIILDHHKIDVENPYAIIVNPQQDNYPNKSLSGSAVVYKFTQVIDETMGVNYADYFLDLVAIGLIGDLMSLEVEENRKMIAEGLRNINNLGVKAIISEKKKDINNITATDVSYGITPMLNGATRMENIKVAIDTLLAPNEKEAKKFAKQLNEMNEKRKTKEIEIFDRVKNKVDDSDKVAIIIDNDIDKSFNGLIATKIASELQKPAIVMQEKSSSYGGSFRRVNDIDMMSVLNETGCVPFVAGHPFAGGLALNLGDLDKLKGRLNYIFRDEDFTETFYYDLELREEEISMEDVKDIEKFCFIVGQGIPAPRFKISNLFVNERNVLGKNTDTIKISCDGLDLMKFKTNDRYAEDVNSFDEIDVIGTLNINKFYNWKTKKLSVTIQMFLDDWKFSE